MGDGETMTLDRLHSYPKVWNLGHPAIADLFSGAVVVQEKVDGSQFTFGVIGGELHCRSKGAVVPLETRDANFRPAVDTAIRLHTEGLLPEGCQYRGEALRVPKHNTNAYERVPVGNVILFDVDLALETRMDPEALAAEAERLGLECVPTFYYGVVASVDDVQRLLDTDSLLGGCKVEGIVFKNHARWGEDGKMLMGKMVSADFKERHQHDWKGRNPTKTDIVELLISTFAHERRWEKAVERLRDAGELESSPRDIGKLISEIPDDIKAECEAEIRDALWKHFWPQIARGTTRGMPAWYKQRLLEKQFATEAA